MKNAINSHQFNSWTTRVTSEPEFSRFFQIHNITSIPDSVQKCCTICDWSFTDIMTHATCDCTCTAHLREILFNIIIENFNLHHYVELSFYDSDSLFCVLLGKPQLQMPDKVLCEFRFFVLYSHCKSNCRI